MPVACQTCIFFARIIHAARDALWKLKGDTFVETKPMLARKKPKTQKSDGVGPTASISRCVTIDALHVFQECSEHPKERTPQPRRRERDACVCWARSLFAFNVCVVNST